MKNFYSQTSLLSIIVLGLCISVHSMPSSNSGNNNPPTHTKNEDRDKDVVKFEEICRKVCNQSHPCPPECADLIDPWAMDTYPLYLNKRSPGIDGFTFDDYLFLRWLGRDMKRHRLQ